MTRNQGLDQRFSHSGQNHGRITKAQMAEMIMDAEGIPTPSAERFARSLELSKKSTAELKEAAGLA